MTLSFPDLNVWLALADVAHTHSTAAWHWRQHLPPDHRLVFSRYTQIGLLRLLTNSAVMGERVLSLGDAWEMYDRWLADPHVDFYPEPHDLELAFRHITRPLAAKPASKVVGDCFLLAHASELGATLITFDRGLCAFACQHGYAAVNPAA